MLFRPLPPSRPIFFLAQVATHRTERVILPQSVRRSSSASLVWFGCWLAWLALGGCYLLCLLVCFAKYLLCVFVILEILVGISSRLVSSSRARRLFSFKCSSSSSSSLVSLEPACHSFCVIRSVSFVLCVLVVYSSWVSFVFLRVCVICHFYLVS